MAEKEERILIDVINPGINCVYRLDNDPKGQSLCKHNGNMEPVTATECRHCDEGMTRQEAINRMAYAMLKADDPEAANEWLQLQWNSARIRKHYLVMAEAALNSLLGDDE